jgi:hypothetical protein
VLACTASRRPPMINGASMSLSRKPRRFVRKPSAQLNVRVDPPTVTLMKDMCALWKRKQGEVFRARRSSGDICARRASSASRWRWSAAVGRIPPNAPAVARRTDQRRKGQPFEIFRTRFLSGSARGASGAEMWGHAGSPLGRRGHWGLFHRRHGMSHFDRNSGAVVPASSTLDKSLERNILGNILS